MGKVRSIQIVNLSKVLDKEREKIDCKAGPFYGTDNL